MHVPVIKQPLNSFGTWMVWTLAKLDLQQKDLAEMLGTTREYLSYLARGENASEALRTRWKKRSQDALECYRNKLKPNTTLQSKGGE